ncbi:MAG: TolB family protein [Candidatus Sumerlaeota bacterium]
MVNGDVNSHRVSPDGKYVVYLADQNTNGRDELFVVDLDGDSTPVRVNPALDADENVLNYAFSPDGQYIVYHADQDIDNVWELYYAPARGGGVARKMHPDLSGDKDVYPFKITPLGYDPMEP